MTRLRRSIWRSQRRDRLPRKDGQKCPEVVFDAELMLDVSAWGDHRSPQVLMRDVVCNTTCTAGVTRVVLVSAVDHPACIPGGITTSLFMYKDTWPSLTLTRPRRVPVQMT